MLGHKWSQHQESIQVTCRFEHFFQLLGFSKFIYLKLGNQSTNRQYIVKAFTGGFKMQMKIELLKI